MTKHALTGAGPTPSEQAAAAAWFAAASSPAAFPLSFLYADRPFADLLPAWDAQVTEERREDRQVRTVLLSDPASGLQCRCELTLFSAFPAVEWVAYFRNSGAEDTAIISDIHALDASFPVDEPARCTLHYARGSSTAAEDYEPLQVELGEHRLTSQAGVPSWLFLPFFNLELGDRGVLGAVGWTGNWEAHFRRGPQRGPVHVQAGMPRTHLRLRPGEEIRTPRIALLFWEGDRLHGHNLWRQFLLAHHVLRLDGQVLPGPMCHANWGESPVAQQIAKALWWRDQGLPCDVFWVDAGWFGDASVPEQATVFTSDWNQQVGNWQPNSALYPDGLRPLGEAVAQAGMTFLLWFEAERARAGTRLASEHPAWMLGPLHDTYLINLGLPEAREGMTDLISALLTEFRVGVYRQDLNNMSPADFWEQADAPDRVGMTEIRHVEGLYRFWDDLRERHPGLYLDNCAGGGKRIDLETISRSLPLWPSDYQCYAGFDPIGCQAQAQGLSLWIPLRGGVWEGTSLYGARSAMGPAVTLTTNLYESGSAPSVPLPILRSGLEEQSRARPFFLGDFYPLLSYTLADDAWCAWQWHRPDLGAGLLLLFRRQHSPFPRLEAKLHGLDPEARYQVRDEDTGAAEEHTGQQLTDRGLTVDIADQPGSALLWYRRLD